VLELPDPVRADLLEHARQGTPEEVVGVLAGTRGEEVSTVERSFRADNAADTPGTRYEIAPAEELELLERVDAEGLEVVGFYHSHPRGPLEPSEVDARRAAWPGCSYLVVSLGQRPPAVGSWRWTGDRFREEPVHSP